MVNNRKIFLAEKVKKNSLKKGSFLSNRSMSPSIDKKSDKLAKKYYSS